MKWTSPSPTITIFSAFTSQRKSQSALCIPIPSSKHRSSLLLSTHSQSSRRRVAARRVLRSPSPAARDRRGLAVESPARNGHLRFAAPPAVLSAGLSLWFPAGRRRRRGKRTAARWNHRGELDGVGMESGLERQREEAGDLDQRKRRFGV